MKYQLKVDWSGSSYVGFHIKHDQTQGILTLSMPKYISDAVKRYKVDVTKIVDNPFAQDASNYPSDLRRRTRRRESKKSSECFCITRELSTQRS
jgi:hypothetical protein